MAKKIKAPRDENDAVVSAACQACGRLWSLTKVVVQGANDQTEDNVSGENDELERRLRSEAHGRLLVVKLDLAQV